MTLLKKTTEDLFLNQPLQFSIKMSCLSLSNIISKIRSWDFLLKIILLCLQALWEVCWAKAIFCKGCRCRILHEELQQRGSGARQIWVWVQALPFHWAVIFLNPFTKVCVCTRNGIKTYLYILITTTITLRRKTFTQIYQETFLPRGIIHIWNELYRKLSAI